MALLRKVSSLNWIANVVLPLAAVLMEVTWVVPWLMLMGRWPIFLQQRTPLGLVSVLVLMGASYAITRFSIGRKWSLRRTRLVIVASGLAAVLSVMRLEYPDGSELLDPQWFVHFGRLLIASFSRPNQMVLGLLVSLYLWWRGISLGRSALFFENIYRSFSVGLIALVVLIVSWGRDPETSFMGIAGPYLAAFFFVGLSGLALSRLQSMERRKEKETKAVFNGRWLALIGVVTLAIILVGVGASGLFSSESIFFSVIGKIFNLITGVLFKIVFFATALVAYFVAVTLFIVQSIINMLVQKPPPDQIQISANATMIENIEQGAARTLPPQVMQAIEWGILVLVIGGALFLLGMAILRLRHVGQEDDVEEVHESLWSREGFLADLRLFLRLMWQQLRGKVRQIIPHSRPVGDYEEDDANDHLGVREIYRRLLRQSAQIGVTRRIQETPLEYEKRLAQTVPEGEAPLNELTGLYLDVRYGDRAVGEVQVRSANGLWRTLQRLLKPPEADQAG